MLEDEWVLMTVATLALALLMLVVLTPWIIVLIP